MPMQEEGIRFNIDLNSNQATASLNSFNNSLNQTNKSQQTTQKEFKNSRLATIKFSDGLKLATGALTALGGAFGVVLGARGITSLVTGFITAASTTEQYKTRIDVLIGSQKESNRLFQDLTKYASEVPFTYQAVVESATNLAGVMKGNVDEIDKWLPLIGDLAASTGLSIQETTSQVSRMYSAGAASADLFRERGISAMLGFKTGVSYSVEDTRRILMESWNKTDSNFRGAADKLANTWTGLMSFVRDRWFKFQNLVADAGFFNILKKNLGDLLAYFDDLSKNGTLKQWATTIGESLTLAVKHVGKLKKNLGDLLAYFDDLSKNGTLKQWATTIGESLTFAVKHVGKLINIFELLAEIVGVSLITKLGQYTASLLTSTTATQSATVATNELVGVEGADLVVKSQEINLLQIMAKATIYAASAQAHLVEVMLAVAGAEEGLSLAHQTRIADLKFSNQLTQRSISRLEDQATALGTTATATTAAGTAARSAAAGFSLLNFAIAGVVSYNIGHWAGEWLGKLEAVDQGATYLAEGIKFTFLNISNFINLAFQGLRYTLSTTLNWISDKLNTAVAFYFEIFKKLANFVPGLNITAEAPQLALVPLEEITTKISDITASIAASALNIARDTEGYWDVLTKSTEKELEAANKVLEAEKKIKKEIENISNKLLSKLDIVDVPKKKIKKEIDIVDVPKIENDIDSVSSYASSTMIDSADEIATAFTNAFDVLQNTFKNITYEASRVFGDLATGIDVDFQDVARSIQRVFSNMASQLVQQNLFDPLLQQLKFNMSAYGQQQPITRQGVSIPGVQQPSMTANYAVGGLAAASTGLSLYQQQQAGSLTPLSGALQGAMAGAAIGSIIPGVGTAIGGAVGGLAGLATGLFSKHEKKIEASLNAFWDVVDGQVSNVGSTSKHMSDAQVRDIQISVQKSIDAQLEYFNKVAQLFQAPTPSFTTSLSQRGTISGEGISTQAATKAFLQQYATQAQVQGRATIEEFLKLIAPATKRVYGYSILSKDAVEAARSYSFLMEEANKDMNYFWNESLPAWIATLGDETAKQLDDYFKQLDANLQQMFDFISPSISNALQVGLADPNNGLDTFYQSFKSNLAEAVKGAILEGVITQNFAPFLLQTLGEITNKAGEVLRPSLINALQTFATNPEELTATKITKDYWGITQENLKGQAALDQILTNIFSDLNKNITSLAPAFEALSTTMGLIDTSLGINSNAVEDNTSSTVDNTTALIGPINDFLTYLSGAQLGAGEPLNLADITNQLNDLYGLAYSTGSVESFQDWSEYFKQVAQQAFENQPGYAQLLESTRQQTLAIPAYQAMVGRTNVSNQNASFNGTINVQIGDQPLKGMITDYIEQPDVKQYLARPSGTLRSSSGILRR